MKVDVAEAAGVPRCFPELKTVLMLLFVLDILTHLVFLHFRPLHHQKNQYVVMSMQKKKKRKEILREKIHSLLNYLGCKNVLLRMLLRMQSLIF